PGPLGTLLMPSATGGANWQGGAFDPETKQLFVYTVKAATSLGLVPSDPGRSDFGYVQGVARDPNAQPTAGGRGGRGGGVPGGGGPGVPGGGGRGGEEGGGGGLTVQGLPIFKPPYASIVAFDMNKGD